MFDIANPVAWLIGIVIFAALFAALRGCFNQEARERRRRNRSHGRIVSKARRPMISLAATTAAEEKPRR